MNKLLKFSLVFLAIFLWSIPSWGTLTKNDDGYYVIKTDSDFIEFRDSIDAGMVFMKAKLVYNIKVTESASKSSKTYNNWFRGTLDGQGYTITLDLNNTDSISSGYGLFEHTEPGCVIKNLKVAGQITTPSQFVGGIVGKAYGTKFINCVSDVTLNINISGDATCGGLVGETFDECFFDHCAFTGTINGAEATNCGGFVGWNKDMCSIVSSYVAGKFSNASGDCNFLRNPKSGANTFINNYYVSQDGAVAGTLQGKSATQEQLYNGELVYLLNQSGHTGPTWRQNLSYNKGKAPLPWGIYGLVVKQDDGTYKDPVSCSHGSYTDHICKYCGATEEGYTVDPPQTLSSAGDNQYWVNYFEYSVNSDTKEATVIAIKNSSDVNAAWVPDSVTINGVTYAVTEIGRMGLWTNSISPDNHSVTISKTVKKIDDKAFENSNCTRLNFLDGNETLTLGVSDTHGLFHYCYKVTDLYIGRNFAWPTNSTEATTEPFNNQTGGYKIARLVFGPRVTLIGNNSLSNPRQYANYDLFKNCTTISDVFYLGDEESRSTTVNDYSYDEIITGGHLYLDRNIKPYYTSSVEKSFIKVGALEVGPNAKQITNNEFGSYYPNNYSNTSLKTADFSNARNLTSIGDYSFQGCPNLEKIDLSHTNVATIGTKAFYKDKALVSATLSNYITRISSEAFEYCALISMSLPPSLKNVGTEAFYGCDKMTSLTIYDCDDPLYFENDGTYSDAFYNCDALVTAYIGRNITFPTGKEKASAFYKNAFQNVVIGDHVTAVQDYTFKGVEDLTSLIIGTGLTEIGENVFADTKIHTLTFNDTETPIAIPYKFKDYPIETLMIGRPLYNSSGYAYTFSDFSQGTLSFVQFSETAGAVGPAMFRGVNTLKSVRLPNNIKICSHAFENCTSLKTLYIDGNVRFLFDTFSGCTALEDITITGDTVEIVDEEFEGCTNLKTIQVNFKSRPHEYNKSVFADAAYANATLTNLYDDPYEQCDLNVSPWCYFTKRAIPGQNDFHPSDSDKVQSPYGYFDHATLKTKVPAGKWVAICLPFETSTYYYGPHAKIYNLMTFIDQDAMYTKQYTVSVDDKNDASFNFATPVDLNGGYRLRICPYLINATKADSLIQGTFDQFKAKQVHTSTIGRDSTITYFIWTMTVNQKKFDVTKYYVVDDGYFKYVNGDYTLPAYGILFKINALSTTNNCHFTTIENGDTVKLLQDDETIIPHEKLQGYSTFYSTKSHFMAPEGVEVYTVRPIKMDDGTMAVTLWRVEDGVINKGSAVLLYGLGIAGNEVSLPMVTSASTDTAAYNHNILKGVDVDTQVSDLNSDCIYVLSTNQQYENPGFYRYSAGRILGAGKGYLDPAAWGDNSEVPVFLLPTNPSTGIGSVNAAGNSGYTYDLLGRRVLNKQKGAVYIQGNQKFIEK